MPAQDVLKRLANTYTHDESGIVFYMQPFQSLRVMIMDKSLREADIDSHRNDDMGVAADTFLMLDGYCIDIDFPEDMPDEYKGLQAYWRERLPLSVAERFMLFTDAIGLGSFSLVRDAYLKTRDKAVAAPPELQETPTNNDSVEKKSE